MAGMEVFDVKTPIGWFEVAVQGAKLTRAEFVKRGKGPGEMNEAVKEMKEYFEGKRKEFEVKVEFEKGTEFQRRVWREIAKIPFGKTVSYSELARKVGRPKAVRAVASACGANPVPVVVPCHRVVGSPSASLRVNSSEISKGVKLKNLGGYSGGIEKKRWLLRHEGVKVRA